MLTSGTIWHSKDAIRRRAGEAGLSARVLVVEDEAMIRRLLVTMCEREGLQVEATDDGAEAVEQIRS